MTIDTEQINCPQKEQKHGKAAKAGYFTQHWLEMCVAMCIGWGVLGLLFGWSVGLIGISNPNIQIPEVATLAAAFSMTLPMAAWMRYRKMEWRPIGEMSAAMFVEAILLIGVAQFGILQRSSLVPWLHYLMMPAMLVPMFLRFDLYSGHHGSHQHQAHH
jgi:hypothetical protein